MTTALKNRADAEASKKRILVATHNQHKVQELRHMMQDLPLDWYSLADVGWTEEIAETGDTFCANACLKREALVQAYPDWLILADDSGLCVDALQGAPGIYTARYGGPGATQQDQFSLLWKELRATGVDETQWTARFVCCLALYVPGPSPRRIEWEASCQGQILPRCEGDGGFGYDPIFFCSEANRPMATLTAEDKNRYSHRGQAVRSLRMFLHSILPGSTCTLRSLCQQQPEDPALKLLLNNHPEWQDEPIRAYTVAYLRHPDGERVLFLYRNKKESDLNQNKNIGIGGKVESGESWEQASAREIYEETGIQVLNQTFHGWVLYADIQAKSSKEWMIMALYGSEDYVTDRSLTHPETWDCPEGTLQWLTWEAFLQQPHWKGDEPWLQCMLEYKQARVCWASVYRGDDLICDSSFVAREEAR